MDPTKALDDLKKFRPDKAEWSMLPVIASAVASGASYLKISVDPGGMVMDFDGAQLPDKSLETLFEIPFSEDRGPWRELALSLAALNQADPSWVTYESWDGAKGGRAKIEAGKVKFERYTKSPWKEGTKCNRVRVQTKKGWRPFGGLFGAKQGELPPEAYTVEELCRFAGLNLEINGQQMNVPVELGRSLVTTVMKASPATTATTLNLAKQDCLDLVEVASPGAYTAALSLGGETPKGLTSLNLVVNGVLYQKNSKSLTGLGVRAFVASSDLLLDAGRVDVQETPFFHELVKQMEAQSLKMGDLLAEQLADMNSLDRVEATDYIKTIADKLEGLNDVEAAANLYQRLLESQEEALGDDDPELVSTLLKLAQLREESGDYSDCAPLYTRVLEIYETSKPEPAQMATCQAGLAQIRFTEEKLEEAESLAKLALDTRLRCLDRDDALIGASYELLARIYRARYSYPNRKFMEVDSLYLNALKIFERNFGSNHLDVAVIVHDLAEHRRKQRRYKEAEPLYKRALKIREDSLGSKDQMVAQTLDGMGALYEEQGKSALAGEHYGRALKIWDEILGPEHPEVGERLNNLVVLYRLYGRFAEAEPLYQRLLNIQDKSQVDLVNHMTNLGLLYQAQGKLDQAEPMLTRALQLLESGAEENRPELGWVLNHMGALFDQQGRYDNAEAVHKRALKLWEELLGPDHLDLTVSLEALTKHYRLAGAFEKALEVADRSLVIKERTLGKDHPETITTLGTVAELKRAMGNADARTMHQEVLLRRARSLEPVDPAGDNTPSHQEERKESRYSAAKLEAEQLEKEAAVPAKTYRRYPEAEVLYLRALFAREQSLGPNHHDICYSLDLLANLYKKHRKYEGAEELFVRALNLRRASLGPRHPDLCTTMQDLIDIYCVQKRYGQAEPIGKDWMSLVEDTLGAEHPEVCRPLERLAEIAGASGNSEKMEEYNRRALEIRHTALGTEHPDFATSLADLLCIQKRYDEAGKLYGFVVNCLEETVGPEAIELIPVYEKYAGVLRKLNKEAAAVEL